MVVGDRMREASFVVYVCGRESGGTGDPQGWDYAHGTFVLFPSPKHTSTLGKRESRERARQFVAPGFCACSGEGSAYIVLNLKGGGPAVSDESCVRYTIISI